MSTNEHFDSTERSARQGSGSPQAFCHGCEPGGSEPSNVVGRRGGHAVTLATTEHFNLQAARALTVSEATGRANIYLAALSSSLIALAFIGQISRFGAAFAASALLLLPVLVFVGVVTFLRVVQSSIEDLAYAHRIGLLRSYYLSVAPELEPYLVVARSTRSAERGNGNPGPRTWQLMLTVAGMVAVINSVVLAAAAGLALRAAGVDPLAISVAVGALTGTAVVWLHARHHRRALDRYSVDAVDQAAIVLTQSDQADTA